MKMKYWIPMIALLGASASCDKIKQSASEKVSSGAEQVAEGVWTCGTALALARAAGVAVPVMEQVDAILHQGKRPKDAVIELMRRDPRAERD